MNIRHTDMDVIEWL